MASSNKQTGDVVPPSSTALPTPAADPQRGALIIKDGSAVGVLSAVINKGSQTLDQLQSCQIYRDEILAASGRPSDPVERMLLEQLMFAHHQIGNLQAKSALASSVEQVDLYCSAATKLMAEFRRTSLALKEYRGPNLPRQLTLVQQQNLAAGDQQVALVDGTVAENAAGEITDDVKLGNRRGALPYEEPTPTIAAADRRQEKLAEAPRLYARGSPALTNSNTG